MRLSQVTHLEDRLQNTVKERRIAFVIREDGEQGGMRIHSDQEPITELHGGTEEVFLGTGNPSGLDAADTGNNIAGILRVREEVGLVVGRGEIVLKRLPGEYEFIVFDVQFGGSWADDNCLVNPGHGGGHWLEETRSDRQTYRTGFESNRLPQTARSLSSRARL